MKLALIAALTDARVIGKGKALPWHLSEDLKRFKSLTLGHAVIMGRKTWESLPKRPLPGRANVVLSRDPQFLAEGAVVCGSLKQAVGELAAEHALAFVIGGESLFKEALAVAERLHLTWVHKDFEGEVKFPDFDLGQWRESARSEGLSPEGWTYHFVDYFRA